MQNESAYTKVNNRLRSLSAIQYALLLWLVAFSLSILVGLGLAGNSPATAAMSAAGGATGVAIVSYVMGQPERTD